MNALRFPAPLPHRGFQYFRRNQNASGSRAMPVFAGPSSWRKPGSGELTSASAAFW